MSAQNCSVSSAKKLISWVLHFKSSWCWASCAIYRTIGWPCLLWSCTPSAERAIRPFRNRSDEVRQSALDCRRGSSGNFLQSNPLFLSTLSSRLTIWQLPKLSTLATSLAFKDLPILYPCCLPPQAYPSDLYCPASADSPQSIWPW